MLVIPLFEKHFGGQCWVCSQLSLLNTTPFNLTLLQQQTLLVPTIKFRPNRKSGVANRALVSARKNNLHEVGVCNVSLVSVFSSILYTKEYNYIFCQKSPSSLQCFRILIFTGRVFA